MRWNTPEYRLFHPTRAGLVKTPQTSFPRSAWERIPRRSASCGGTQSVQGDIPTPSVGTIKVQIAILSPHNLK